MKKNRRIIVAATIATAGLLAVLTPTAAVADDYVKIGTRVSGPDGACADGQNAVNDNVKVCFKAYGDKLYVKDKNADGRSAYGSFDTDYVRWDGGDKKACRNPYGQGTWVVCDYSIVEDTHVKFHGYTRDNTGTINLTRNVTAWAYDFS